MMQLSIGIAAVITLLSTLAGFSLANEPERISTSQPVVTQLVFRDRSVTINLGADEYLYSVSDESGSLLSASLTEEQFAAQYPELFELFRPAIADEGTDLLMLAPMVD